jgi:membrane protease YdiL (CAAX protease family)
MAVTRIRLAVAYVVAVLILSVSLIGSRGSPTAYLLNVGLTMTAVSLLLSSTASALCAFGSLINRRRPVDDAGQRPGVSTLVVANLVVCGLSVAFSCSLHGLSRWVSGQLPGTPLSPVAVLSALRFVRGPFRRGSRFPGGY